MRGDGDKDQDGAVTDPSWNPAVLPDLSGRTAVVTGANSGLGFHTAAGLARAGAQVVLTARDGAKGDEALHRLKSQVPGADARVAVLDLADLASVRAFARDLPGDRLDLLVNNAGVMATPRRTTADGFELQLGTNHLGHFALTGLLLPRLLTGSMPTGSMATGSEPTGSTADGPARVVTVSSGLHRRGRLNREDLMLERGYTPFGAYAQSKLANLLFALELQRLVDAAAAPLASLAAHPGFAATNLQTAGPRMMGSRVREKINVLMSAVLAQPAEHGAWPTLRAATDPAASGGEYFGPNGRGEMRGAPVRVGMSEQAADADAARWLWNRSQELTGVRYDALHAPPAA